MKQEPDAVVRGARLLLGLLLLSLLLGLSGLGLLVHLLWGQTP